ncbi:MAG: TetR family transcriptional regulator [Ruminococcaceae bacterium]|nr:TetR family transcriptional regulator [Oscillospiraceae bacterium]
MDRRQRKTRSAIFSAFIELLEKKNYSKISVGEIIERADIGRATFYAHFETKDFLLKELCEELFEHILNNDKNYDCNFDGGSVFLHLLKHLQENNNNILGLLSSENNEIFLRYFKSNLKKLVIAEYSDNENFKNGKLPEDYLVNHICASFVEAVSYWISHKMQQTPEEITKYFLATIEPII